MVKETPTLAPGTVLARADDVLTAEIDGEAVMMSIEEGEYYGLDETGTAIWELLETPHSLGEVLDVLRERYEVEPDVCRRDVERFLSDLLSDGTLQIVEETSGAET